MTLWEKVDIVYINYFMSYKVCVCDLQVFEGRSYVQGTSEFDTTKQWISDGWRDMGFQNAVCYETMPMFSLHFDSRPKTGPDD